MKQYAATAHSGILILPLHNTSTSGMWKEDRAIESPWMYPLFPELHHIDATFTMPTWACFETTEADPLNGAGKSHLTFLP